MSVDLSSRWRKFARCRGMNTEQFFPIGETDHETRARAIGVCRGGCPVRWHCLSFALSISTRSGVYGGYDLEQVSARTRRRLRHYAEAARQREVVPA